MKRTLLLFLFLPLLANAQLRLRPYATGGYFKDMVRQEGKVPIGSYLSTSTASTNGFFAGLGLNASLPVLPLGFQVEAAYERHSLNYYVMDYRRITGYYEIGIGTPPPSYPSSAAVLKLAPAITFLKVKRLSFSYGAELGAAYRLRITNKSAADNNYTNLFAGLSAGYSALLVKIGYEYGLSSTLKTWQDLPMQHSFWGNVKSSRINIGLTVYPTMFFKK